MLLEATMRKLIELRSAVRNAVNKTVSEPQAAGSEIEVGHYVAGVLRIPPLRVRDDPP